MQRRQSPRTSAGTEWLPRRAPARPTGLPRIMLRRRITWPIPKTMGDRKRKAARRRPRGATCHDRLVRPTATAHSEPRPHHPQKEHLARQALRGTFLDRRVHICPARHPMEAPCQAHRRPARKIRLAQEMPLGRRVLPARSLRSRAQLVRARKMLRGQPRGLGRRARRLSMKLPPARKLRRGRDQLPSPVPRKADTRIRPSVRRSLTGVGARGGCLAPSELIARLRGILGPALPPAAVTRPVLDGGIDRCRHIKSSRERKQRRPEG